VKMKEELLILFIIYFNQRSECSFYKLML
jgi:hypothetical protein